MATQRPCEPPSSTEDDSWDELEEGVPQKSDQFIQKYFQGRDALIGQEKRQRTDHAFRQTLSPAAAEASAIVARIREEERQTHWTSDYKENLAHGEAGHVYPGMMFCLAKERIEATRLWKIVQRMPKGALLHAHLDAMIDVTWLLEQALHTEGMHLYAGEPLCTPTALRSASMLFVYAPSAPASPSSLWGADYVPATRVALTHAADTFPDGGREGFVAWVKGRCTITSTESVAHHHGLNDIWRKFRETFIILGSIIFYEPIFRACVHRICRQALEDGVRWIDLRAAFAFQYRKQGCEQPEAGYEEVVRVLGDEVERFKTSEEGQAFWGARMIWTAVRQLDTRQIVESMKQCIAVKKRYPHLIAGFDLVGQEDLGRSLKDLTRELFWFRKRCVEEGLEIPFFFHAGETLGDGDETDENLFDALLLGTRRIGHGFSLYKHPLLIDMVKEKRILVESCPISNEVLRLTSSIRAHPAPALLARGVHVALCNDDPAILGHDTNGMSHDFWQALQGWENLGLIGLGALAENSVRWAAFEDQSAKDWVRDIKDASLGRGVRAKRMREWALEWQRYCQWIVDEYGEGARTEGGSEGEEVDVDLIP
ncbi:MAG: hypothetical protein M1838_005468 [Thelocarpon superellum]|nr:MAG: hypothetical protein M1838_005468 [Thelocarpon superellum]